MAMVVTSRAHFLTLCVILALLPPGPALTADPVIKPAIVGLISTGAQPNTLAALNDVTGTVTPSNMIGIFGGLVVQARWKDFQPDNETQLQTSVIDNILTGNPNTVVNNLTQYNNLADYNAAAAAMPAPNNRQLGVRLRIFTGCSGGDNDAPPWAMETDKDKGFPITIEGEYDGNPETCELGNFWDPTSNYSKAWKRFLSRLAARYDANPLIQEISVTSCTSFSAEPFFLNLKVPKFSKMHPAPVPALPFPAHGLRENGFTDALYRECLTRAIDDYADWKTTRVEFSINGFSAMAEQEDYAFSERTMRRCRLLAGPRCILSNHDLDTDTMTPASILPIFAFERKFGPNLTFQTYHVVPSDFEGTLRKGISLGASSIEVWQEAGLGSFEHQSRATLANWASMFEPH
jgi:hypothetical protein